MSAQDIFRRDLLRLLAGLALLAAGALGNAQANAAPRADLWPRWTEHQPGSQRTVEHAAWTALLQRYVTTGPDGVARFDYGAVGEADRARLDAYLRHLAAVPVSRLDRPEQLAFWLNLYNALTVDLVLDHYPVRSIREIRLSPWPFVAGPWGAKLVSVEGARLSLDDIEHRILRPIWRDPRIHYGVNCAAVGCPDLLSSAFTGATVEAQLQAAARGFVNHPRAVALRRGRLRVSSIYDWFKEDFGGDDAGVIAHLRAHAEPGLLALLEKAGRIGEDHYDWRLNDLAG